MLPVTDAGFWTQEMCASLGVGPWRAVSADERWMVDEQNSPTLLSAARAGWCNNQSSGNGGRGDVFAEYYCVGGWVGVIPRGM